MKVLLVYDSPHTKQSIMDSLVAEGFKHEFVFAIDLTLDLLHSALLEADEAWQFGECETNVALKLAKEHSIDIWRMG